MNYNLSISVIGLGFVGSAISETLMDKGMIVGEDLFIYDKFKKEQNHSKLQECLRTTIMFLALPTQYKHEIKQYDKSAIIETCKKLTDAKYSGTVVIKSTVEPQTTNKLSIEFPELSFVHNPEFLSAATAKEDFKNQQHIVLGKGSNCTEDKFKQLKYFYQRYFPNIKISTCTSLQSESMKIFCNCFYATKIQFFNEIYMLCQKTGCNFNIVKDMMLGNGWISPMHTSVPGNDGMMSYGGYCFPKDTNALNEYMQQMNVPHAVLESVIKQRNTMRQDHINEC